MVNRVMVHGIKNIKRLIIMLVSVKGYIVKLKVYDS